MNTALAVALTVLSVSRSYPAHPVKAVHQRAASTKPISRVLTRESLSGDWDFVVTSKLMVGVTPFRPPSL
jgi:hypothetical protein